MEEDIETCGWFVFYKDQLLIEKKNGMYTIPFGTEPPMPVPVGSTIHTIGEIEGRTAKTSPYMPRCPAAKMTAT